MVRRSGPEKPPPNSNCGGLFFAYHGQFLVTKKAEGHPEKPPPNSASEQEAEWAGAMGTHVPGFFWSGRACLGEWPRFAARNAESEEQTC